MGFVNTVRLTGDSTPARWLGTAWSVPMTWKNCASPNSHISSKNWKAHFRDKLRYEAHLWRLLALICIQPRIKSLTLKDRLIKMYSLNPDRIDAPVIFHGRLTKFRRRLIPCCLQEEELSGWCPGPISLYGSAKNSVSNWSTHKPCEGFWTL